MVGLSIWFLPSEVIWERLLLTHELLFLSLVPVDAMVDDMVSSDALFSSKNLASVK